MPFSHLQLILTSSLISICIAFTPPAMAGARQWAEGHILVKPKAGIKGKEFKASLQQAGASSTGKLRGLDVHMVKVPPHAEQAMVAALSRNPNVEFAELDELVEHTATTANDTYYGNAWHLQTMNAPQAWDQSLGNGVVVAVLDTGVDPNHPDLAGQLVPGWNIYNNSADSADVYGHGTKVAGVIAAVSNNGMGVTSLAWNAKVMPVRISQDNGWAYISTIANGITWAADHGADVANISYYVSDSSSVKNAASYLRSKGGVVVSSAGNDGSQLSTANTDAIITVSATGSSDSLTSWSNYGNVIDVAAPGSGIWSTKDGGGYGAVSGTSFSSPATAAVVALVMARNPSLTPAQIDAIITGSSVDLGAPGQDIYFGHGRVDAAAAVAAAGGGGSPTPPPEPEPEPEPDAQAPNVNILSPTADATVSGRVKISISASDNVAVATVKCYVDNVLLATGSGSSLDCTWNARKATAGPHTIKAEAIDTSDKTASTQVRVNIGSSVVTGSKKKGRNK